MLMSASWPSLVADEDILWSSRNLSFFATLYHLSPIVFFSISIKYWRNAILRPQSTVDGLSADTKLWRSGESNPTKSHNQGLKWLYNYISDTEL